MADLLFKLFSVDGQSMRAWRWYRVRQVCLMVPLFMALSVINNVGMALDWLLFPSFTKQAIRQPVFVVSLPRTGTTNLLHALNAPGMPFTSMKLWEILLAPSIVQKRIIRWCWQRMPHSLQRRVRRFDERLFNSLNNVHHASLFLPEEDDLMLMWSFSTAFMGMFYPETDVMRAHFRFDEAISERQKKRIMKRYRRLVQRHLYAVRAGDDVRFLSKNPAMAAKVQALASHFPDGQAVVIERPPHNVLPSTMLLVETQVTLATDVAISERETQAIFDVLAFFRQNLQRQLADRRVMPHTVVRFTDLVRDRDATINALLNWLGSNAEYRPHEQHRVHTSKKSYTPLTDQELASVLDEPWPVWPSESILTVTSSSTQPS